MDKWRAAEVRARSRVRNLLAVRGLEDGRAPGLPLGVNEHAVSSRGFDEAESCLLLVGAVDARQLSPAGRALGFPAGEGQFLAAVLHETECFPGCNGEDMIRDANMLVLMQ